MANNSSLISYSLVNKHVAIENGPVEIVDLPSYKMVIFHSCLLTFTRGYQDLVQDGFLPSPRLIAQLAQSQRKCVVCVLCVAESIPGWWFQTCLIFHFIYGMSSFPLTH